MCGIYRIVNLKTHDFYIGQSTNIQRRWSLHLSALRCKSHPSIKLQKSYDAASEDDFYFEVLAKCEPRELLATEADYIERLRPALNVAGVKWRWNERMRRRESLSTCPCGAYKKYGDRYCRSCAKDKMLLIECSGYFGEEETYFAIHPPVNLQNVQSGAQLYR